MKTYSQFINGAQLNQLNEQLEYLNELTAMGMISAVKLKNILSKIKQTDDIKKKIDLLAISTAFALGTIALELHKKRKR